MTNVNINTNGNLKEHLSAILDGESRSKLATAIWSYAKAAKNTLTLYGPEIQLQINITEKAAAAEIVSEDDFVIRLTDETGKKIEMSYRCDISAYGAINFLVSYAGIRQEHKQQVEQERKERQIKRQLEALQYFYHLRDTLAADELMCEYGIKIRIETNSTQLACGMSNKDDIFLITNLGNQERRRRFACTIEDFEKCEMLINYERERQQAEAEAEDTAQYQEEYNQECEEVLGELLSEAVSKYGWRYYSQDDEKFPIIVTIPYDDSSFTLSVGVDEAGILLVNALCNLEEQFRLQTERVDARIESLAAISSKQCFARYLELKPTIEDLGWKMKINTTSEDAAAAKISFDDFVIEASFGSEILRLELQCTWLYYQTLVFLIQVINAWQKKIDCYDIAADLQAVGLIPDEAESACDSLATLETIFRSQ